MLKGDTVTIRPYALVVNKPQPEASVTLVMCAACPQPTRRLVINELWLNLGEESQKHLVIHLGLIETR